VLCALIPVLQQKYAIRPIPTARMQYANLWAQALANPLFLGNGRWKPKMKLPQTNLCLQLPLYSCCDGNAILWPEAGHTYAYLWARILATPLFLCALQSLAFAVAGLRQALGRWRSHTS